MSSSSSSSSTAAALPVPAYFPGDTKLHGYVSYHYVSDEIFYAYLLKHPSYVNHCNEAGQIPLHLATQCAYFYGITTLLQYGSDLQISDFKGRKPLHIAAMLPSYSTDILTLFLDHLQRYPSPSSLSSSTVTTPLTPTQYIQSTDYEGYTALHYAAAVGNNDTVYLLLQYNRSVINQRSTQGDTALHLALGGLHLSTIKLLLMNNASLTIQASDGRTAIEMATATGSQSIIKLVHKFSQHTIPHPSTSVTIPNAKQYNHNHILNATNPSSGNGNNVRPPALPPPHMNYANNNHGVLSAPSYSSSPVMVPPPSSYSPLSPYYASYVAPHPSPPYYNTLPPSNDPFRSSPYHHGYGSSSPVPLPNLPRSSPPLFRSSSSSSSSSSTYAVTPPPPPGLPPNYASNMSGNNVHNHTYTTPTKLSSSNSTFPSSSSSAGALEGLLSLVHHSRSHHSNTNYTTDGNTITSSSPRNSNSTVHSNHKDHVYTLTNSTNGNANFNPSPTTEDKLYRNAVHAGVLDDIGDSVSVHANSYTAYNGEEDYASVTTDNRHDSFLPSQTLPLRQPSSSSSSSSSSPASPSSSSSSIHPFYSPVPSASPLLMGQGKLPGDTTSYLGYTNMKDTTTMDTSLQPSMDHQAAIRSASTPLPRPGSRSFPVPNSTTSTATTTMKATPPHPNETSSSDEYTIKTNDPYPTFTIPPPGTARPIPRSPRDNLSSSSHNLGGTGVTMDHNDTLRRNNSNIPSPPSVSSHGAFSTPQVSPRTVMKNTIIPTTPPPYNGVSSSSSSSTSTNPTTIHFGTDDCTTELMKLSSHELIHLVYTYRQRIETLEKELHAVKTNENNLRRQLNVVTTENTNSTTNTIIPVKETETGHSAGNNATPAIHDATVIVESTTLPDTVFPTADKTTSLSHDNDNHGDEEGFDDEEGFEEASAGSVLMDEETFVPDNGVVSSSPLSPSFTDPSLSLPTTTNPFMNASNRPVFVYTLPPPSPAVQDKRTSDISSSSVSSSPEPILSSSSSASSSLIDRSSIHITNRHLAVWAKFFENAARLTLQEKNTIDHSASSSSSSSLPLLTDRMVSPVPDNPLPLAMSTLENNLATVEQLIVKGACSNRITAIPLSSSSGTTTVSYSYPYPSSSLGPPFPSPRLPIDTVTPLVVQTSPLHLAAAVVCNVHILSLLVDGAEESNLDILDEYGSTPLLASLFTTLERIHALEKYLDDELSIPATVKVTETSTASPTPPDPSTYRTMIMNYHIPLIHNVLHCVKFLLESAVSTTVRNTNGIDCRHILSFINAILLKEEKNSNVTTITKNEVTEVTDNGTNLGEKNASSPLSSPSSPDHSSSSSFDVYRTLPLTKYREMKALLEIYVE